MMILAFRRLSTRRFRQQDALVCLVGQGDKFRRELSVVGARESLEAELLLQFQQMFTARLVALGIKVQAPVGTLS
jgi:hypothetical protein